MGSDRDSSDELLADTVGGAGCAGGAGGAGAGCAGGAGCTGTRGKMSSSEEVMFRDVEDCLRTDLPFFKQQTSSRHSSRPTTSRMTATIRIYTVNEHTM